MAKFTLFVSIVVLIAALVLLFDKLFTPQPIQITLQSGQEVTTSTPEYFSLTEALLMVISAFLIGTAATYLFYNSERAKAPSNQKTEAKQNEGIYDSILPLLKHDERAVIKALMESNGEMQQNKLSVKLGISKVKATRLLYSLERKNLIVKERYGLTNKIKLQLI